MKGGGDVRREKMLQRSDTQNWDGVVRGQSGKEMDAAGQSTNGAESGVKEGIVVDGAAFDAVLPVGNVNGGQGCCEQSEKGDGVGDEVKLRVPDADVSSLEGDDALAAVVVGVFAGPEEEEKSNENEVCEGVPERGLVLALKGDGSLDGAVGQR